MNNFLSGLYIVSTPIVNLEDITLRALNLLKNSDKILCEDTRRSIKLLNHYGIKKKLISHHKFNEKRILDPTIKFIQNGGIVSIISDAGTPTLSDPGLILIRECIKKKISVIPIPGVSAITTAMSASGFEDKYYFYGFLPKKNKNILSELNKIKKYNLNIVFFIPAIKINFYISFFKKIFNNRNLFIAREMTKIHETFYRENLENFKGFKKPVKGELTVILSSSKNETNTKNILNEKAISDEILKYLKRYTLKDVVKLVSEKNNISKKKIYELCLNLKKNEKIR